jgi:hypothetical protein
MEDPDPLAGSNIEAAHIPFVVAHASGRHALLKRRTDNYGVAGHHGRRLEPDFASGEIREYRLVIVEFEIDRAVFAKPGHKRAGFGVECDQPVAGSDVEDALLFAIGPVGHAASRQLAGGSRGAGSFALAVHPHYFAGGCVQRHHRATCAAGGVQHSLDHQRRAFEFVLGPRAQIIGLITPGKLQLAEV